ncbi:hypothetical protein TYRP_020421 [Tyrophagus putrescentiae]|nr:hypothetical protein TYRP_020421 [Tyrophagus putrescentiae]
MSAEVKTEAEAEATSEREEQGRKKEHENGDETATAKTTSEGSQRLPLKRQQQSALVIHEQKSV